MQLTGTCELLTVYRQLLTENAYLDCQLMFNCVLSCAHVQRDIIKAVRLGFKYSFDILVYPKYISFHNFRISITVYFWLYDIKCSKSTFIRVQEKYNFTKKWCNCKCNINRKDCFIFGNYCFVNVSNIH